MNSTAYVLMMKPSVVGELTTTVGSSGSAAAVDMETLMYTTLFRWQGELMPIQVFLHCHVHVIINFFEMSD